MSCLSGGKEDQRMRSRMEVDGCKGEASRGNKRRKEGESHRSSGQIDASDVVGLRAPSVFRAVGRDEHEEVT